VDRENVFGAAGEALSPLPLHDDLYAQVRDAGGGVFEPIYWRVFAPVPVDQIPVPHNPSNCEHYERFKAFKSSGSDSAGEQFIGSLTPDDRHACRYHQADWRWIADESVRIIAELGHAEVGDYIDAVDQMEGFDEKHLWLRTLFHDPVDIAGGEFTNGQHRACALRFSGARSAAMVVEDEYRGDEEQVWIYQGDG